MNRNHTGHRVGECHQNAKLSDSDVAEMRSLREERPDLWSYAALSLKFGCGESTVRDIVTYRTRGSEPVDRISKASDLRKQVHALLKTPKSFGELMEALPACTLERNVRYAIRTMLRVGNIRQIGLSWKCTYQAVTEEVLDEREVRRKLVGRTDRFETAVALRQKILDFTFGKGYFSTKDIMAHTGDPQTGAACRAMVELGEMVRTGKNNQVMFKAVKETTTSADTLRARMWQKKVANEKAGEAERKALAAQAEPWRTVHLMDKDEDGQERRPIRGQGGQGGVGHLTSSGMYSAAGW